MRSSASLAVLALVCAVALSSCFSLPDPAFEAVREERFIRIDAASDRVEWIEIQHGLTPRTSDFDKHMAEVLARRRVFPAAGGFSALDYDRVDPHSAQGAELDAAAREWLRTLRVSEARLIVDENGCVALWRTGSLERASNWLATERPGVDINGVPGQFYGTALEWIGVPRYELGRIHHEADPTLDEIVLDDRTLELLARADAAGERFWSLRGNSLCLDAPMTQESASRYLALLGRSEFGVQWDASLGTWMRENDTSGERLRARFAPNEGGWMCVAWTWEDLLDEAVLTEKEANDLGLVVDSASAYAQLRRDHGLPELHAVAGEN